MAIDDVKQKELEERRREERWREELERQRLEEEEATIQGMKIGRAKLESLFSRWCTLRHWCCDEKKNKTHFV